MAAGLRVIRGPGWTQGEADGGEGHVGTIVATKADGMTQVTWDGGQQVTVRCESKELRVLDNATIGIVHRDVTCDECHESNIVGMRWKCDECDNYDLCSVCYFNDSHDRNHQFLRFETPGSSPVKMDKRTKSMKIRVLGIFPEATVVRGKDWEWSDQDGGKGEEGVVTDLLTPGGHSARSTVKVTWKSGHSNIYRLGISGKVDLQFTEESPGGECYPQQLPIFDAKSYKDTPRPAAQTVATSGRVQSTQDRVVLTAGDKVYIDLPSQQAQQLRQARSELVQLFGQLGEVQGMSGGDVIVAFGPRKYKISQDVLKKVMTFSAGDRVQVLSDEKKVSDFQDSHGGFIRGMHASLGKVGDVVKVDSDGDVVVQFDGGQKWCYNPACLLPAAGKPLDTVPAAGGGASRRSIAAAEDDEGLAGLGALNQLMGAIVMAAAAQKAAQGMGVMIFLKAVIDNDVSAVRQLLQRDPKLVGASAEGVGALHIAANQGHLEITKLLAENGASINALDKDGDTPLIAGMKYDVVADYLIQKGTDVTVANNTGQTASHRAAAYGHVNILRKLMAKGADFNAMDKVGDTPLHDAITNGRTPAAEVLIGWPKLDIRRKNQKGFPPMQFAAFKGEAAITGLLVRKDRGLVDEQKEDGFTALHVAAFNNHTDVMKVLLEQGKASVDIRIQKKQTALHMAAQQAYMDAVQLLTKHGADVNAKDCDGDRPLHILMMSHTGGVRGGELLLMMLVGQAPKVKEEERVRIACFLLQAGAEPDARNDLGKTALEVCGNQSIVDGVKRFLAANPALRLPKRPALARQTSLTASDLCRKCCSQRADILLVPCGHKAACRPCCSSLRACPQCGGFIKSMHDESGKDIKDKCVIM